jgi:hypothetical protein
MGWAYANTTTVVFMKGSGRMEVDMGLESFHLGMDNGLVKSTKANGKMINVMEMGSIT